MNSKEQLQLKYLYHYTSIETLALILESKQLRFSRLDQMDDPFEVLALGSDQVGRHAFTCCWTSEESESIPMWKMYSNDMKGVRIKLPIDIFDTSDKKIQKIEDEIKAQAQDIESGKILSYLSGQNNPVKELQTRLFVVKQLREMTACSRVHYMDLDTFLKRRNNKENVLQNFLYKPDTWAFQREIRYLCYAHNKDILKYLDSGIVDDEFYRNLVFGSGDIDDCKFINIDVDDEKFKDMTITLGPKSGDGELCIIKTLLKAFNPSAEIRGSGVAVRR